MTAPNQPHKYRCETCAYFIGKMENAFGVDQPFCSNPKIVEYNKQKPETGGQISPTHWCIEDHYIMKKDLYFNPMSNFEVEKINVLGCASHSDATKADPIELYNRIERQSPETGMHVGWVLLATVHKEIMALPQQNKAEQRIADSFDEIINQLQMADGEGESESHQPLIRLSQALKIVDDIKKEALALLREKGE